MVEESLKEKRESLLAREKEGEGGNKSTKHRQMNQKLVRITTVTIKNAN